MIPDCPCRFSAPEDVDVFGPEWAEMHRNHHLWFFPHVDQRTRDNLEELIEIARERVKA